MGAGPEAEGGWLDRFHAGERDVLERCYRDHFRAVELAVGQVLRGADKETVVHEVFLELLDSPNLRRRFQGGHFRAWLTTVAKHHAVDFWRHHRRERSWDEAPQEIPSAESDRTMERSAEARLLAERFLRDCLPAKWLCVFEARFLAGLDQRTAAKRLGLSRTTLAYREIQVRRLLNQYLKGRRRA
jgi:RNA polymerase sigma-70 factor (ECF subfamily)